MGNAVCVGKPPVVEPEKAKVQFVVDDNTNFFPSLKDCTAANVRSVVDGQTLELDDDGRNLIRFAGVDGKECTEDLCVDFLEQYCTPGSTINVQFIAKRQDPLGRLAFVFIPDKKGDGFLCVNMILLELGLAYLYTSPHVHIPHRSLLRSAQSQARKEKRALWENVDESITVLLSTAKSQLFHCMDSDCLDGDKQEMQLGRALDKLYAPCPVCKPM
ncbi:putative nuclease like [Trypanosoma vivax]|nr:micrococcal nuclease [Trypanosoma vivax]KAH8613142.1 putative nuclease like [Trypanosoma vivax]